MLTLFSSCYPPSGLISGKCLPRIMEIQLYYIIIKFLTLIFYYVIICSQSFSSALMVELNILLKPQYGLGSIQIILFTCRFRFPFSNYVTTIGSCYQVELRNNHSCVENSMKHHCPICYEVCNFFILFVGALSWDILTTFFVPTVPFWLY